MSIEIADGMCEQAGLYITRVIVPITIKVFTCLTDYFQHYSRRITPQKQKNNEKYKHTNACDMI
jgi:hypothetical protein